ncbi:hypothetical protein D9O50_03760 [Oxalobacteraceae bacterium CAVE-383]|nr:hypothetical protein D9O50_03760 [Oxalobacteraceae bacterium CAVE-383]
MNSKITQSFVDIALDFLPPSVRHTLLEDKTFLKQWDIATITSVKLIAGGSSFRRDQLYSGIRRSISIQGIAVPIKDKDGTTWDMLVQLKDGVLAFSIRSGDVVYSLMDHSALAEDVATRTAWFEKTANEINFEGTTYRNWLQRLNGAPLSDEEFAELMTDIEQTPASIYLTLQRSMEHGRADPTTLVPHQLHYYEQLIGSLGSTTTVAEYIEVGAKPLIADLQSRRGTEGFLYSLLTCSVGTITENVRIENIDRGELVQTYQWLAQNGDPISQVGAVEIAISHLDTHPELAPFVEQIIEGFIADSPESDSSIFALLSSMIIMVASELSRRRILGKSPPFYRRQAAIAQASIVIRAINGSDIDPMSVTEWAQNSGLGYMFFLQGLIDLRREPRWLPDFVSAEQLRAEFIGRIANAVNRNATKIQLESLQTLLLGPTSKLENAVRWPFSNLPGPLEGELTPRPLIPDNALNVVKAALEAERLEASSFAVLANTALLFELPEGQSSLAASALHRVKFSVEKADDENTAFSLISGLAIVAAVTRGTDLADALRVLARVLRRRRVLVGDLDNELRIAMIAAASFEKIEDWAKFFGGWITEIAFEASAKDTAGRLLSKLRYLIQIEPTLARYCAVADAALTTFTH